VDTHAIQNIAWAFDIPKTVLTADSANRATADTEYRTFVDHTLVPRCKYYESVLNPYLAEFNQRIEFAPEELPELQVDESDRSDSLGKLVTAGIPLRAALDILGYDLSEEAEAELDKAEREKEENKKKMEKQLEEKPDPNNPNGQDPSQAQDETKADLDKWFRKAMKKLKMGESPVVPFESTAIPANLQASIGEGLKSAKTEDDLKAIYGTYSR
jgi:hypothetical protein